MPTKRKTPAPKRSKVKRAYLMIAQDIEAGVKRELGERRGAWPIVEDRTGVGRDWIRQYMMGRIGEPGFYKIVAIAKYLGVSLSPVVSP